MSQIFTKRQWELFKAYQIKFSVRRTERLKLEADLVTIERGFVVLFWITQVAIATYAIATGIFLCYPDAIDATCEEFTPDEQRFMMRASVATETAGGLIFVSTAVTAVLLLISMYKIYVTIRTHYPEWAPNIFFIILQVIAFLVPVVMCILCVIFYQP